MEQLQKILAKIFPSIEPEESLPFILTEEEKEKALYYLAERKKNFYRVQRSGKAYSREEIEDRINLMEIQGQLYTPQEAEQVLAACNRNKHREQEQQKSRDQEKKEQEAQRQELKKLYTAKYLLQTAKQNCLQVYGKPLVMDQNTTPLLKALCFFLSEDERFETELGYSFKKGLLLRGNSGLGKTFLPLLLSGNEYNPIRIISVLDAAGQVRKEGEYTVNMQGAKILCLDDVGREDAPQFFYKSEINWFRNFLESYYLEKRPFNRLIISTNLGFAGLEEKYGYPVRSRLREMLNVVDVIGEDLRK